MIIAFAGRIGKDAEVRTTQGGDSVTQFSVGCNVGRDKTAWVDCSMWGERGEKLAPYLLKGTPVGINGRPAVRAYTKDGEAVGVQQCTVNHVDLLGNKRDDDASRERREPERQRGSGPAPTSYDDDPIPFSPEWR
jgi:single-strand DNA-binding protein